MKRLGKVRLLILDDWGLEPFGPDQRRDLLEIVEERYGHGATLITSQIPVDRWHDIIGEPTIADAILDRIVHNAHRIKLKGDSLRRKLAAQPPATDHATDVMPNDNRSDGRSPPGRHQSESMADFERNQVADINRNARADPIGIRRHVGKQIEDVTG